MDQNLWLQLAGVPRVREIGYLSITNKHPDRTLPFWVLGVVAAGQRTIRLAGVSAKLTSGDYFLLPPGIRHRGIEIDEHAAYFIHFVQEGGQAPAPEIPDTSRLLLSAFGQTPNELDILGHIRWMYQQFRAQLVREELLNTQLLALQQQLSLFAQTTRTGPDGNDMAAQVLDYINRHYADALDSTRFESRFGRSYHRLTIVFKRKYGCTIKQMVMEQRIRHAFNLLMAGQSIAEAARQTGFHDYYYFIRAFKKAKGITPSQLREKYFTRL
ncbi:MAG: AraC family transcriptional regulator [Eubacteriales bacterium]|nr:AraC family transcriptional regulator [Eubacteriales bacterium]